MKEGYDFVNWDNFFELGSWLRRIIKMILIFFLWALVSPSWRLKNFPVLFSAPQSKQKIISCLDILTLLRSTNRIAIQFWLNRHWERIILFIRSSKTLMIWDNQWAGSRGGGGMCEVRFARVVHLLKRLALGNGLFSLLQPRQSMGEHRKPPHNTSRGEANLIK